MAIVRGTAVADQVKKRIGNIVFRQTKDGTVAGQRPASMTNPRTLAQMSQRIRLASLVTFYRASRYWMRKGWELKDRKESDYNAFVKSNLATNPVAFTKGEASNGACVVYPYRISKGSLAPIQFEASGDNMLSNIYIGNGGTIVSGTGYISPLATIGELSALILANNLTPKAGDQLSILGYQQSVDADGTPYVVVSQYEIALDVTDGRLVADFWPITGNGVLVTVGGDAANLQIGINKNSAAGFAMVLSRTEGGQTRVSSQSLIVPDDTNYSYYTSAQHVSEAAASYGQNAEVFLDSNGIEAPSYNPDIILSILGLYVGSEYFPVGAQVPTITSGAQLTVKMNKTAPQVTSIQFYVGGSQSAAQGWEPAAVTVDGYTYSGTAPSNFVMLTKIRVNTADGLRIDGEFNSGVEG